MKLEIFMIARNEIMLRVENIADIYNSNGEVQVQTVNLETVIRGLWDLTNVDCSYSWTVEETTLTGNQSYQAMTENKIKWFTVDDLANSVPN
jgi:hypothetical protein